MKKTLLLIIVMFVLTMFATVSAYSIQDNLSNSSHRIVGVDGPQLPDPHDPPPRHRHRHPPEPPHGPPPPPPGPHDPPPPGPHDPHGPY